MECDYDRMGWFLLIVARLKDRGKDIATMPFSLQTVQDIIRASDEIEDEALRAQGLSPPDRDDDLAWETFQALSSEDWPDGALDRVEAVVEANEWACFQEFLTVTAGSDAREWWELMNRGNARTELGMTDAALDDYLAAEGMAPTLDDRALVAWGTALLFVKLGRWEETEHAARFAAEHTKAEVTRLGPAAALVEALAKLGRYEEALDEAERIIEWVARPHSNSVEHVWRHRACPKLGEILSALAQTGVGARARGLMELMIGAGPA